MKIDTAKEELLRRYLVGDCSGEEMQAIEERFMTDDRFFDEMVAREDELYSEFAADELSSDERAVFEQKFLRTRADRDRAAFAGAFLEITGDIARETRPSTRAETDEKPVFLTAVFSFFAPGRMMQFGMAATLVLLTVGIGVLLVQNSRMRDEIVDLRRTSDADRRLIGSQIAEKEKEKDEIESELAAEREKSTSSESRIRDLESEKSRLEKDVIEQRRIGPAPGSPQTGRLSTLATLVLSPGLLTRSGGGQMSRVDITGGTRSLNLTLRLTGIETYDTFNATVSSVDTGSEIWSKTGLKATGIGSGRNIRLSIPASRLVRGDYEVSLKGIAAGASVEDISTYYFGVNR